MLLVLTAVCIYIEHVANFQKRTHFALPLSLWEEFDHLWLVILGTNNSVWFKDLYVQIICKNYVLSRLQVGWIELQASWDHIWFLWIYANSCNNSHTGGCYDSTYLSFMEVLSLCTKFKSSRHYCIKDRHAGRCISYIFFPFTFISIVLNVVRNCRKIQMSSSVLYLCTSLQQATSACSFSFRRCINKLHISFLGKIT
jgi:hypothetical protein